MSEEQDVDGPYLVERAPNLSDDVEDVDGHRHEEGGVEPRGHQCSAGVAGLTVSTNFN